MILGKRYRTHERIGKTPWYIAFKDQWLTRLGYLIVDEPPTWGHGHTVVPHVVKVETTNNCNANCIMCGHRSYPKDQLTTMPIEKVKAIIDDVSQWKPKPIFQPDLVGEALCDPNIVEIIQYAHNHGLKTRIYSNAALLTSTKLDALTKAGLNSIYLTIDGYTKETYERIREGLHFETVLYNMLNAWDHCRTHGKPYLEIGYVKLPENKHEWEQIRNFWSHRCHNFFSNNEDPSYLPRKTKPLATRKLIEHCQFWKAWTQLAIRTNGDIPMCACMFRWGCDPKMGNAFEGKPLLEIFNSPEWNELRANIYNQKNLPLQCKLVCFGEEEDA